jgi:hypothetical protein
MGNWTAQTSFDEVRRRAGGRNRYNASRRFIAVDRRAKMAKLLKRYDLSVRGSQARMAWELGCSEATVSRDVRLLLASVSVCPTCGSLHQDTSTWGPIKTGRRAAA